MKNNHDDDDSDDQVAKRLFPSTPDKNRVSQWRLSPSAEDYTRQLLGSGQKSGEKKQNIILVMPFFDEQTDRISSDGILSSMFSIINE